MPRQWREGGGNDQNTRHIGEPNPQGQHGREPREEEGAKAVSQDRPTPVHPKPRDRRADALRHLAGTSVGDRPKSCPVPLARSVTPNISFTGRTVSADCRIPTANLMHRLATQGVSADGSETDCQPRELKWTPCVGPLDHCSYWKLAVPVLFDHATQGVCCCCCRGGHVGDAAASSKRSVVSTALPANAPLTPSRHTAIGVRSASA